MHAGLQVALLAEGVDRNPVLPLSESAPETSPSSRRAWIEIVCENFISLLDVVALLAEGVDRNILCMGLLATEPRRPPRGGRG